MGFVSEFKAFAIKGNVVDRAVGTIIGAAFGKIVASFIDDLVMPLVGKAIGNADFNNLFIPLSGQDSKLSLVEAKKAGAVLAYGSFVTVVINFTILAFCIFMMVKAINNMKKNEEAKPAAPAAPPAPSSEEKLLAEIRDLLKAR